MSSQVNFPERRILLLGKTGTGKSATGNTILGEKKFRSEMSLSSLTARSEMKEAVVAGRKVSVVDTPGFFDTSYSNDAIAKELARSMFLSSPGPHALLYVIKFDRFTKQEEDVVALTEKIFGEEMGKYMLILFTCGDQLKGENMDDLIKENEALSRLIKQCGGGYHVFNNKEQSNRDQVNKLMEKIDEMLKNNGGSCYSNEMFEDAGKMKEATRKQEQHMYEKEDKHQQEPEGSGFREFWTKYKTHFTLLAEAVMSGVMAAGRVYCKGGSTNEILCAGAAGAASGAARGALVAAHHQRSEEGVGLGSGTRFLDGSTAAEAEPTVRGTMEEAVLTAALAATLATETLLKRRLIPE